MLLAFVINTSAKENFVIKLKLKNGNNVVNDSLRFGLNTAATNGIDIGLGEVEYPPCFQVFKCSSFIEGTGSNEIYQFADFKPFPDNSSDSVEFYFRVFDIYSKVEFSWENFPAKVSMAKLRSKYQSGAYDDIDMLKQTSLIMTNDLNNEFKIVLKYDDNSDVEEVKKEYATIYPNPISQSFYIKCNDEISTVKIIDLMGNEIKNIYGSFDNINIEELVPGVYYLQVVKSDGSIITKKIVKL